MTMVDIQGLEDFFGDMDFKVGGTHKGITAIQMDLKVHGLTPAIIKEDVYKRQYLMRAQILLSMKQATEALPDVEKAIVLAPEEETSYSVSYTHLFRAL